MHTHAHNYNLSWIRKIWYSNQKFINKRKFSVDKINGKVDEKEKGTQYHKS